MHESVLSPRPDKRRSRRVINTSEAPVADEQINNGPKSGPRKKYLEANLPKVIINERVLPKVITADKNITTEAPYKPSIEQVAQEIQKFFLNLPALQEYVKYLAHHAKNKLPDRKALKLPTGESFSEINWTEHQVRELIDQLETHMRLAIIQQRLESTSGKNAPEAKRESPIEESEIKPNLPATREKVALAINRLDRLMNMLHAGDGNKPEFRRELKLLQRDTHPDQNQHVPEMQSLARLCNRFATLVAEAAGEKRNTDLAELQKEIKTFQSSYPSDIELPPLTSVPPDEVTAMMKEVERMNNEEERIQQTLHAAKQQYSTWDRIHDWNRTRQHRQPSAERMAIDEQEAVLAELEHNRHALMEDIQMAKYQSAHQKLERIVHGQPLLPKSARAIELERIESRAAMGSYYPAPQDAQAAERAYLSSDPDAFELEEAKLEYRQRIQKEQADAKNNQQPRKESGKQKVSSDGAATSPEIMAQRIKPMTIEEAQILVPQAAKMWQTIHDKLATSPETKRLINTLPHMQEWYTSKGKGIDDPAQNYVYAVAKLIRATRGGDRKFADQIAQSLGQVNAALGLSDAEYQALLGGYNIATPLYGTKQREQNTKRRNQRWQM